MRVRKSSASCSIFWRRGVHSQYFTRDRPECRSANTSVGGRIYTIATYLEDHSRDDEGLRVWPRSHRDAELCYGCWSAPPAGEEDFLVDARLFVALVEVHPPTLQVLLALPLPLPVNLQAARREWCESRSPLPWCGALWAYNRVTRDL